MILYSLTTCVVCVKSRVSQYVYRLDQILILIRYIIIFTCIPLYHSILCLVWEDEIWSDLSFRVLCYFPVGSVTGQQTPFFHSYSIHIFSFRRCYHWYCSDWCCPGKLYLLLFWVSCLFYVRIYSTHSMSNSVFRLFPSFQLVLPYCFE